MSADIAKPRSRATRWLVRFGWVLLGLVAAAFAWLRFSVRDRFPGYTVNVRHATTDPKPLRAGFARIDITPDVHDLRDPVWLAGFSQNRRATNVHDPLWASGFVLDDGFARIAVVSLDAIGFFHDDVIRVRQRVSAERKVDYAIVCSTHNHSTPDLMGLWGPSYGQSGVSKKYRERVIQAAAEVVEKAAGELRPVRMSAYELPLSPEGLVADTRKPTVFDPDLRVLRFDDAAGTNTVGTLITWANHPETPWSDNQDITADFPGVLRDLVEKGIRYRGEIIEPGLGGIPVFVNGAVGGLMTTHPSTTVRDPILKEDFKRPSHEKTWALGSQLAIRVLQGIRESPSVGESRVAISIRAQTLDLPMDNNGFFLAGFLGLVDRGHAGWRRIRTETAVLRVGDISIVCIPGEIYPELVNGGVVKAPGGDYGIDPLEIPPVREMMSGRIKFVFGLANDEIGYIIPKSEWDRDPPFLFEARNRPYGEINSLGPETAVLLHGAIRRQLEELKAMSSRSP